jgi:hypothetical protein
MRRTLFENYLLPLLRNALFDCEIKVSLYSELTKADWLEILCIANQHGVEAIAFESIMHNVLSKKQRKVKIYQPQL